MRKIFALPDEIVSVVASPRASRFSTTLIYSLINFALASFGSLSQPAKSIYDFPFLDIACLTFLNLLMLLAHWLIHKRLRIVRLALATAIAWLLSTFLAIAAGLAVIYAISGVAIADYRIHSFFFDVISGSVNLASYSIVIAAISRYRASSKALKRELGNLALLRKGLATQISQVRERYSSQVRRDVEPVLAEISQAIQSLDASAVMKRARAAIEQVVLPLNRQIENYHPVELEDLPELPSTVNSRISFKEVFNQRIQLSTLILPFTTALVFVASLLGAFDYVFGETGIAVGLLSLAALLILQVSAVLLLRQVNLNIFAAAIVLLFTSIAFSVMSVSIGTMILSSPNQDSVQFMQIGVLIILLVTGIFQMAIATTNSHLERVSKSNDDYASLLKNRDSNLRALRLRISQAIHGDIQGKLRAVLLRVNSGGINEQNMPQLTEDLKHIERVLQELGAALPIDFDTELNALKEFWSGVCELEFCDKSQTIRSIASDPELAEAAIEVLTEAVANAVKHGAAKTAWVTFDSQGSIVNIEVKNQASAQQVSPLSTGAGSRRFDELCRSWSLAEQDGHTVFECELISAK